jgi:hypothetical protein
MMPDGTVGHIDIGQISLCRPVLSICLGGLTPLTFTRYRFRLMDMSAAKVNETGVSKNELWLMLWSMLLSIFLGKTQQFHWWTQLQGTRGREAERQKKQSGIAEEHRNGQPGKEEIRVKIIENLGKRTRKIHDETGMTNDEIQIQATR